MFEFIWTCMMLSIKASIGLLFWAIIIGISLLLLGLLIAWLAGEFR